MSRNLPRRAKQLQEAWEWGDKFASLAADKVQAAAERVQAAQSWMEAAELEEVVKLCRSAAGCFKLVKEAELEAWQARKAAQRQKKHGRAQQQQRQREQQQGGQQQEGPPRKLSRRERRNRKDWLDRRRCLEGEEQGDEEMEEQGEEEGEEQGDEEMEEQGEKEGEEQGEEEGGGRVLACCRPYAPCAAYTDRKFVPVDMQGQGMPSKEEATRELAEAQAILEAAAQSSSTASNTGRLQAAVSRAQQVVNGPPPLRPTFTCTFRVDRLPQANCPRPGIIGGDTGLTKISASEVIVPDSAMITEPMSEPPYFKGFAAEGRDLDPRTAGDIPPADALHRHPPARQIPPHRKSLKEGGSQFLCLSWQLRRMECAMQRARKHWQRQCSLAGLDEVLAEMAQQRIAVSKENEQAARLARWVQAAPLDCRP